MTNTSMENQALLDKIRPDSQLPVPLHYQIRTALAQLIRSGELAPGYRLPPGKSIAAGIGVSEVTALRAISALEKEGLLVTKRGVGTRIAQPMPGVTEVVLAGWMRGGSDPALEGFARQIMAGLQAGEADPKRQYLVTYQHGYIPTARQMIEAARARRINKIIVYRPTQHMTPILPEIAEEIACISLLQEVSVPTVACVTCDPTQAMRTMLAKRLCQGKRSFACIGVAGWGDRAAGNPYATLYSALEAFLLEAGIAPRALVAPAHNPNTLPEMREAAVQRFIDESARMLEPGTVVLAEFARIALRLRVLNPSLEILTYTESRAAVADCLASGISVIHMPVESIGRAAAQLTCPVHGGFGDGAPVVRLAPEILEAGSPGSLKTDMARDGLGEAV